MQLIRTKSPLLCLLLLLTWVGAGRAEEASQEYQLKLAFLVNFTRFITWPDQSFSAAQPDFNLCVLGGNPFGDSLNGVNGRKTGERIIVARRITSLADSRPCHLLYVDQSEAGHLATLLPVLARQAVVTVSDIAGFSKAGGSIELVIQDHKLSFIINNSQLKQLGIQTSSALLNLAIVIL